MTARQVRAQFWAARVPEVAAPFDTVHLKIFYPAGEPDRFSGIALPDPADAPYPVVVIVPGINVNPESYRWLATDLAARGLVAVTWSWVGELFPGQYGITPGAVFANLSPDGWGRGPTSDALRPVIEGLRAANDRILGGALDLGRVILGGHSGGGSVALQNATREWFPEVVAGFSYAAHAGLAQALGWPPASIVAPRGGVPFLFMNGTRDGVIAGSARRYGVQAWDPVRRTIDEALSPGSVYVSFSGANHFAMGWPEDPTVARGFLDMEPTVDPAETRAALAEYVGLFCLAHGRRDSTAAAQLEQRLADPPAGVVAEAGTVRAPAVAG